MVQTLLKVLALEVVAGKHRREEVAVYWGEHTAYLDEIVFRFITETQSEIEAMRGGEVDAIYPQPQLELANLQRLPNLTIATQAGTAWEHADFQLDHPLLGETFVRQAIAHAVDSRAMVDQLSADLAPDLEPLGWPRATMASTNATASD